MPVFRGGTTLRVADAIMVVREASLPADPQEFAASLLGNTKATLCTYGHVPSEFGEFVYSTVRMFRHDLQRVSDDEENALLSILPDTPSDCQHFHDRVISQSSGQLRESWHANPLDKQ
jgi:hypothetical protein